MTTTSRTPQQQGQSVARRAPVKSAIAMMEEARDRISVFLPKGVEFERVIGEVALAVRENPVIADCTPESVVRSVIRALRMDLEIGVEFYLVPFNEKGTKVCTGIAGYKGLANLAVRCGAARSVSSHCVYEGDQFAMEHGLNPVLRHQPERDPKKRGALLGAYYLIELPRGVPLFDYLPLADIDAVRAKSKQWNQNIVKDCPPWWARKRAVLAGLTLVPKNVRFANALAKVVDLDEEETPPALENGLPTDDLADRPRAEVADADGVEITREREPGDEEYLDDRDLDQ